MLKKSCWLCTKVCSLASRRRPARPPRPLPPPPPLRQQSKRTVQVASSVMDDNPSLVSSIAKAVTGTGTTGNPTLSASQVSPADAPTTCRCLIAAALALVLVAVTPLIMRRTTINNRTNANRSGANPVPNPSQSSSSSPSNNAATSVPGNGYHVPRDISSKSKVTQKLSSTIEESIQSLHKTQSKFSLM